MCVKSQAILPKYKYSVLLYFYMSDPLDPNIQNSSHTSTLLHIKWHF